MTDRLPLFPLGSVLFPGLLLLIYAPVIFERSEPPYLDASGRTQDPYLERWLALTAVLLAVTALSYVACVLRARRRSR